MTWKDEEVKKVKITLERPTAKGDNIVAIFGVTGKQKSDFETMLINYLEFIEKNNGIVDQIGDVIDGVTGEKRELSISIKGSNQALFVQELRRCAQPFTIMM